jgi:heterodisulfide reductase subunit A-like polyferredoxin
MLASSGDVASVATSSCAGCSPCANHCQFEAITVGNGHATVDPVSCMGCAVCIAKCPQEAISLLIDPTRGQPLVIRELMDRAANPNRD